jgi:hypothetical protein
MPIKLMRHCSLQPLKTNHIHTTASMGSLSSLQRGLHFSIPLGAEWIYRFQLVQPRPDLIADALSVVTGRRRLL